MCTNAFFLSVCVRTRLIYMYGTNFVHAKSCTRQHTRVCALTHAHVHTLTHAHALTRTHIHTRTRTHTNTHSLSHTHSLTQTLRHLYYVNESDTVISRIHLDGTTKRVIHNSIHESLFAQPRQPIYKIIGLAVDSQNRLFWTAQNQTVIRYINITEWEETDKSVRGRL